MSDFQQPAGQEQPPVDYAKMIDDHKKYMIEKGLYPKDHPLSDQTVEQPKSE